MNIFGKDARDYDYICDAAPENYTEDQTRQDLGWSTCDWDYAPQYSYRDAQRMTDAEVVTAAIGLLTNNLQAVQAESEEILRRMFELDMFIPINTNVPEGATSKAINVVNRFGKGRFINKDGSNAQRAQASVNRVSYKIEYGGLIASWSLQELRESLFAGVPLDSETIEAVIDGCNYHIQDVGFIGDADEGFEGLVNNSNIPIYGGTVPQFDTATDDEIIAFINALITDRGVASNEVFYQKFKGSDLVMALPTEAFDILSTRAYGNDKNKTLMEWITSRNAWSTRTKRDLVFKSLVEAGSAGVGAEGRLTMYPMDKRVLEMDMPIAPRTTRVVDKEYTVNTPYEYSISGLNVKRGSLCIYADGVTAAAS